MPWKVEFTNNTDDPNVGTLTATMVEPVTTPKGEIEEAIRHTYSRRFNGQNDDAAAFVQEARQAWQQASAETNRKTGIARKIEEALNRPL